MGTLAAPRPRARRVAEVASTAFCAVALGLVAVLLLGRVAGYRPLIDYSDSMRPALDSGDVLISRAVPARSIRTGEIVSFSDPAIGGRLVTHRVRAIHAAEKRLFFVTRGDANAVAERWSVPIAASVAEVDLRIPRLGWATAWLNSGLARIVTILLLGLALMTVLVRRIGAA